MNAPINARFTVHYPGEPGFKLKVNLNLPGSGITALFGPSGSGKTTLLRCIAGLEPAVTGYMSLQGEVWQDTDTHYFLPTYKRAIGYVFQEASLFPHLSVQRNLEYGLKRCRLNMTESDMSLIWRQTIDLLGIGHLLPRMPFHLSGGEQQRVAIARALLTRPKMLLMDEPLAALDIQRKEEILPYLERLHDELAIPILYVSHQPDEVLRLADHLVLLQNGQVVTSGQLQDISTWQDFPTAFYEEAGTVINVTVGQHDLQYHLTELHFNGEKIFVPYKEIAVGKKIRIQVRARDVSLALSVHADSSILNRIATTIVDISNAKHPAHVMVRLDVSGATLWAHITRRSYDQLGLEIGKPVWAQIKSVALLV